MPSSHVFRGPSFFLTTAPSIIATTLTALVDGLQHGTALTLPAFREALATGATDSFHWRRAALERRKAYVGDADAPHVEEYWKDDLAAVSLFVSEQHARARMRSDHQVACRVAMANVFGYASKEPSFVAALRCIALDVVRADRQTSKAARFQTDSHHVLADAVRPDVLAFSVSVDREQPHDPLRLIESFAAFCELRYGKTIAQPQVDRVRNRLARLRSAMGDSELATVGAQWQLFASSTARPTGTNFINILCQLRWEASVRVGVNRLIYPAMPVAVQRTFGELKLGKEQRETDDGISITGSGGIVVARYASIERSDREAIRRGAARMRKGTNEKIIRFLMRMVHEQAVAGVNPFSRVIIIGGKDEFGRLAGITDKEERSHLGDYLEGLQAFRGGRRDIPSLLHYWETKAAPGRRSELRIDVGEALAPGYVHRLIKEGAIAPDTHLLPVLPVPTLPKDIDKAQAPFLYELQWQMLGEMRQNLAALDDGWIGQAILGRASDRAGVTLKTAERALQYWLEADNEWLKPAATRGRITLADEQALDLFRDARSKGMEKRSDKAAVAKTSRRPSSRRGRRG